MGVSMTGAPRVAFVTGAGCGMGLSVTCVFLREGWTVIGADLTPPVIEGGTGALVPLTIDVRDRKGLEEALKRLVPELGGEVHAVANVAGVYPPSTLDDFTEELYRTVFDINVLGVLNVMAAATPFMPAGSLFRCMLPSHSS
jgi:NAD(P)-dependent dehydrogenase (short-subunit alcohol dehydrogenase family)